MLGSFGVTGGLFWFGWSARPNVHWIVPVLAGVSFGWGNLCIFVRLLDPSSSSVADNLQAACILFVIDVYGPLNGASAAAASSLARYTAGAAFPLFTVQSKLIHLGFCGQILMASFSV